jgi:hypothetical protein
MLECHQCRHLLGELRADQNPGIALQFDRPLRQVELAQAVQVRDRLGRQRQAVARGKLRDPLAVTLALPDFGPQAAVDVLRRRRELLLAGRQQLLHPGKRYTGVGQRRDPDELHDGRGVVAPVARVVTLGLGEQSLGVVVAYGADRDARVGSELTDRQHVRPASSRR